MALTSPYELYQRTQIDTASPVKLIVMLYDGAIRFLKQAQVAMQAGDREKQNNLLLRSQRILSELMSALNLEEGGDIAVNLLALYQFMQEQLVLANLEDDQARVQKVCEMLQSLREAWIQVEQMTRVSAQEEVPSAA